MLCLTIYWPCTTHKEQRNLHDHKHSKCQQRNIKKETRGCKTTTTRTDCYLSNLTLQNMSRRSSFGLIHDATASQKKIKSYKIKQSYRLEISTYTSENNAWCSFCKLWMVFDPNSQLLLLLCIYFSLNSENGKLFYTQMFSNRNCWVSYIKPQWHQPKLSPLHHTNISSIHHSNIISIPAVHI